jgi:hypothetical protein
MTDIAKCKGMDCPVKERCYRFTAESDEFGQTYFMDIPGEFKPDGKFICDRYWGENPGEVWSEEIK